MSATAAAPIPSPTESYIPLSAIQSTNLVEPVVIGNLVAFTMFGVSLLQFWLLSGQYITLWRSGNFKAASGDYFNSTIIFLLFISDLEDSIVKGIFCDRYIRGTIIGGLLAMEYAPRTIATTGISDGFVASLTHLVYARRLLRISKARTSSSRWGMWVVVAIGMTVSVAQFVASCIVSKIVLGAANTWWPDALIAGCIWTGGAAFVDSWFAAAFIMNILQHRKDTFKQTRSVIIRWTIFTIEFGVITTALQLLHLLIFIIPHDPNKAWHLGVAMVVSKAYINSILLLMRNVLANRIKNAEGGMPTSQSSGTRYQSRVTGNPTSPMSPVGFKGSMHGGMGSMHGGMGGLQSPGSPGFAAGRDRALTSGIVVTSQTHYQHEDALEMPHVRKQEMGSPRRWDEKADPDSGYPGVY